MNTPEDFVKTQVTPPACSKCGEGGIRTRGKGLIPYTGLANRRFRPLSHLSWNKIDTTGTRCVHRAPQVMVSVIIITVLGCVYGNLVDLKRKKHGTGVAVNTP